MGQLDGRKALVVAGVNGIARVAVERLTLARAEAPDSGSQTP